MDEQLLRLQLDAVDRAIHRLRDEGVRANERLIADLAAWTSKVRAKLEQHDCAGADG